jgi:hypothetical protein
LDAGHVTNTGRRALAGRLANAGFTSLHAYNAGSGTPLLRIEADKYILFQQYNLFEALYECHPFGRDGGVVGSSGGVGLSLRLCSISASNLWRLEQPARLCGGSLKARRSSEIFASKRSPISRSGGNESHQITRA